LKILLLLALLVFLVLCGAAYQLLGTARDRRRFPPPGRLVNIGASCLHLVESGAGHPTVVFESGISASCLNWTHIRREVAQFTRACAYDRASLGWSDPAAEPRMASRIVEELHALLAEAAVPAPYILVGHSFGGLLVRCYAATYPNDVAGMVLVDPLAASDWLNISEGQSRMLRRGVALSRRGAMLARIGLVRFALMLFAGGARRIPKGIAKLTSGTGESVISRLAGEVGKMPPEVWPMVQAHWCLPKSFAGMADALVALPAIAAEAASVHLPSSIPVSVLSGAQSAPHQLAAREELARNSQHGRHMIGSNSGHWIHLDEPELVVRAIRDLTDLARAR
jgi:pimeloyl-ACP methyl ester carboxylesterase